MNVSRLLELIQEVLHVEEDHHLQRTLTALVGALQQMVSNPQDADHQTDVADKLKELRQSLEGAHSDLAAAAYEFLDEVNGEDFFSPVLAENIAHEMRENAMTPSVVNAFVEKTVASREQLLENMRSARKTLLALGFRRTDLEAGTAELGFLIPRDIFDNTIGGLAEELQLIDRLVGVFSEAVTGRREHPILDQLSTTKPLVLLIAAPAVVKAIAETVKFVLETYKQIVDIKEVRERTRGLKIAIDLMLKGFDDHIKKVIDEAIDARIDILIPARGVGRQQEVANGGLRWAIKYLMSRIERGMKIEVKSLPPPKAVIEGEDERPAAEKEEEAKVEAMFGSIEDAQRELRFDGIDVGTPVLQLEPPPPPEKKARKQRKPRKAKAAAAE
jgi:hypothetical protein